MFDIESIELSLFEFSFIHIFYVLILLFYWKRYVTDFDEYQEPQPFFVLLLITYLIFAYDGGDFYHYAYIVQKGHYNSVEPVYQIIGDFVGNNYILFRLVVWGGSYLFFFLTCKRFLLDPYKVSFFLFAVYIMIFDYARATLGMAIYFYGISYLCRPIDNNKIGSYIIGLIIMATSVIFHRSMFLTMAATFMIFVPMRRNVFLLTLVIFIVSIPFINKLFWWIVNHGIMGMDDLNEKIEDYSIQAFNDSYSMFEWARRIIEYFTFFAPFLIVAYKFFTKEEDVDDRFNAMQRLFKITFGLLMLSVTTLLVDLNTFTLFYRYLYMSMIPICLLFCYAREQNMVSSSLYKKIIYIGVLCKLFGFAKRIGGGSLSK